MIGANPANLWGRCRGPLGRIAPSARLWCWLLLMSTCIVARPATLAELGLVTAVVAGWLIAGGMSGRAMLRIGLLALALFGPMVLLVPWSTSIATSTDVAGLVPLVRGRWVAPWHVLIRSAACLSLGVGLVSTTTEADFNRALSRLPLPRLLLVMVQQVFRSLTPVLAESVGMSRAIALRAGSRGWKSALELIRALPLVWLPRVLTRVERVSRAMQVRGYRGELPAAEPWPWAGPEWLSLIVATTALTVAGTLRCLS